MSDLQFIATALERDEWRARAESAEAALAECREELEKARGMLDRVLDAGVEAWHSGPSMVPLHDHLGLTWDEYDAYVERKGIFSPPLPVERRAMVEIPGDLRGRVVVLTLCRRSGQMPMDCGLSACENGCYEYEVELVPLTLLRERGGERDGDE